MPDFNLSVLSLANLRDLQKSVAKAISTFEVRQKAQAREKVEILAKELGFTLAALEEPKRKRAPSTKIYRHPENPTLTWSGRGLKPGWFAAHVDAVSIRTNSSAEKVQPRSLELGGGDLEPQPASRIVEP